MKNFICLLLLVLFFAGCATNSPNAEFVKSVTFSSLQDFNYKHTIISGLDFRESEEMILENLSESVLTTAFKGRGFEEVKANGDFYIVTKWKKMVSSTPSPFDSVDGAFDSLNRRDNPTYRFTSRLHLTVEAYESLTGNLFWQKDLPNIFDAIQFTEERVVQSLERAVKNFPQRIEKDPNLPDIQ